MKKTAIALAAALLVSACTQQIEVEHSQVFSKGGLIYQTGETKPFTGKVKGFNGSGFPTDNCDTEFENGLPNGEVICFYSNGNNVAYTGNYVDGLRNGEAVWYSEKTGLIGGKTNYLNNKKHGLEEIFNIHDGSLEKRTEYTDDLKNGIEEHYKDTILTARYSFKSNQRHGQSTEWDTAGNITSEFSWENGRKRTGYQMARQENGDYLRQELKNGKKHGLYTQPFYRWQTKDWVYTEETVYDEGTIVRSGKFNYVSGKRVPSSETLYKDGKPFSSWHRSYNTDGEIVREKNYVRPYADREVDDRYSYAGLAPVGLINLEAERIIDSAGAREGKGDNGCRYRRRGIDEVYWDNGIIVKRKVSVVNISDLEYIDRYIHYDWLNSGKGPYFCDEPSSYYEVLSDISESEYASRDKYEAVSKDVYDSFTWDTFIEKTGSKSSLTLTEIEAPKSASVTESDTISCTLENNKKLSISALASSPQYTYGQGDRVELELPTQAEGSTVYKGGEMFSGGDASYLAFTNGDYTYVAYDGMGSGWEFIGLKVYKGSDVIMESQCDPSSAFSLRLEGIHAPEGELPY